MPTTAELTAIRRAAARARWDKPQRKTARLRITIPAEIADDLRAAADKAGLSLSDFAERLIVTGLGDCAAAGATQAALEATADACCVVAGAPLICRLRFSPGEAPAVEVKEGDPAHPFVAWVRRHAADTLAKIAPGLALAERTEIRDEWRGRSVVIMAARGTRE